MDAIQFSNELETQHETAPVPDLGVVLNGDPMKRPFAFTIGNDVTSVGRNGITELLSPLAD
jgi:hypothetical protein